MLLVLGLLVVGLARGAAAEAAASCTTPCNKDLRVYRTHSTDGRQHKSTYDRDFGVYRTRELPPSKPIGKPKQ